MSFTCHTHPQNSARASRGQYSAFALAILLLAVTSLVSVTTAQVIKLPLVRNPRGRPAQIRQGLQMAAKRGENDQQQNHQNVSGFSLAYPTNREFFVQVEVGMPPQTFNLTLDTASSSLWLPSTECSETECPDGRYNPSKSSTFHGSNISFSLDYNVGTVNGTYCTESVSLAGFTIPNQTVALANAVYGKIFPAGDVGNGVIGFAYPGRNAARGFSNDVPFIFNLVEHGLIARPVFSVFLNSQNNINCRGAGGSCSGELMIGGIDSTKYNGTLRYAPVLLYSSSSDKDHTTRATHAYWAVGGVGVQTTTGYNSTLRIMEEFILDTGSTLTYTPHAEGIVKSLNLTYTVDSGSGGYVVDCAIQEDIQNMTITFQVARTLHGSRARRFSNPIKIAVAAQDLLLPGNAETLDKATKCLFGIAPTNQGRTIIGESLLRTQYTVYDIKYDRIGFASAR